VADHLDELDELARDALDALQAAGDLDALEAVRVRFTGRKSPLTSVQRGLRDLDDDGRREVGQALNRFKDEFEARFEAARSAFARAALDARLEAEREDLTLPPRRVRPGRPHLLTQVTEEIVDIFTGLGYRVADGPEVEAGVYAFDLLNIPPDHPARQEMDTLYVSREGDVVLRPHTSPVQARTMLVQPVPIAVVVPGRVYRADTPDATHSPFFTQVEGLYVDDDVTMADLRGTLLTFARAIFGADREVRLRPSFFPFTEPSAEVDVSCPFCAGDGAPCRVCSGTGWIEILGAGMVDPQVLSDCGHDPAKVSGFAFGVGVERVAMLRHEVSDIRYFHDGDVRFLRAF
jgi:phenylalanyl-tRNA synthetase alpha chain